MIKSVTLNGFRGLECLSVPLSSLTMLTGTNGVGKTSVLEALYCLFSQSRLDVSPLSRYNKSIYINVNNSDNRTTGFNVRQNYNYRLFWDECPSYGKSSCSVNAVSSNGSIWSWQYKRAKLYDMDQKMRALSPLSIDASSEFALWDWQIKEKTKNMGYSQAANKDITYRSAQILTSDGGLYLFPLSAQIKSICQYMDFTSIRVQTQKLIFQTSRQLTKALKLINPHITDIRLKDLESGLSAVLDDKNEVSLGTIGNGAVTWAGALMAIFEIVEIVNSQSADIPALILIDEMGAGIHYSAMLDVWAFLREFIIHNFNIQFIFTSHSADCIHAFCETFLNNKDAAVVRLHRTSIGDKIIPTEYKNDSFMNIIDGQWEVRG